MKQRFIKPVALPYYTALLIPLVTFSGVSFFQKMLHAVFGKKAARTTFDFGQLLPFVMDIVLI